MQHRPHATAAADPPPVDDATAGGPVGTGSWSDRWCASMTVPLPRGIMRHATVGEKRAPVRTALDENPGGECRAFTAPVFASGQAFLRNTKGDVVSVDLRSDKIVR